MLSYLFEFIIALLITFIFYKNEKPKLKFLVLGCLFFFVSLFLQIPVKFAQYYLNTVIDNVSIIPQILLLLIGIIVAEITKYISLKKFMKTSSFKNGIFFGIGWTTLESISIFSLWFYTSLFSILSIDFRPEYFITPDIPFLSFIFFFGVNLGLTVLIILSIIRKKPLFVIYAILLELVLLIGLITTTGVTKIILSTFFYALFLCFIFYYRLLNKFI